MPQSHRAASGVWLYWLARCLHRPSFAAATTAADMGLCDMAAWGRHRQPSAPWMARQCLATRCKSSLQMPTQVRGQSCRCPGMVLRRCQLFQQLPAPANYRLAGGEVQSILRCLLLASHTQQPAGHLNPPLACACLILTVRSTATQGGANSGWATSALSALHWSLWWAGSELATSLQQYGACTAPNRRLLPRRVLQARQPCRPHRG